jgi:tRNA-splicing ligase RtcB
MAAVASEDGFKYSPSELSPSTVIRTFDQDRAFIKQLDPVRYRIESGFVHNMRVPGIFYANHVLSPLVFDEMEVFASRKGVGGFLPAVKQIANVSALPGIVKYSIGLPDLHSGYGFAIGNVAACTHSFSTSLTSLVSES